ncbi:class F sortase [Streptomyces sp. SID4917]|nr:class F sortase [Streptomyces sp. SID4917]SCF77724.1 Sortase family protein [Streptomyces sp. MnatMP-M17]
MSFYRSGRRRCKDDCDYDYNYDSRYGYNHQQGYGHYCNRHRGGSGWTIAITICIGVWLMGNGSKQVTPPTPPASESFDDTGSGSSADAGSGTRSGHRVAPAAAPMSSAAPVALRIPAIKVDTPLLGLGLDRDGSLDVPPTGVRNVAGWYKDGPSPGAKGSAIIAGHVDNARGPAVFYKLGTLRKGQRIEVARADGRTAVFSVDALEVYENADFPERKVYGSTDRPELRVITCGGGFSKKTGYKGNVVAYAHLTGVK